VRPHAKNTLVRTARLASSIARAGPRTGEDHGTSRAGYHRSPARRYGSLQAVQEGSAEHQAGLEAPGRTASARADGVDEHAASSESGCSPPARSPAAIWRVRSRSLHVTRRSPYGAHGIGPRQCRGMVPGSDVVVGANRRATRDGEERGRSHRHVQQTLVVSVKTRSPLFKL